MMEKQFGIPYLTAFVTYDPEEVMAFYKQLSEILSEDLVSDVQREKEQAEEAIRHAVGVIRDYPIAVDYQAVMRPESGPDAGKTWVPCRDDCFRQCSGI